MEPPVRIEVAACEPCRAAADRWQVTFLVVNVTSSSVALRDAWLPHGRFRGDGHIPLAVLIQPGDRHVLRLGVAAREEPGTVVENAFLILQTETCRVFARMRVEFDADGAARPVLEAVTAQSLI